MVSQLQISTKEAVLSYLLKDGEGSATDLAKLLRVSVQAMRRHLRTLEEDGFVEAISISLGPGRPSNIWRLTSQGQNCFNNGKGSEKFALDLMGSLESSLSSKTLSFVLNKQVCEQATIYREKIGSGEINDRLEQLVELRNKEGHLAEFSKSNDAPSSWYLNAFHCSIRGIAEKFPIVCDHELELIRQIFPDCIVNRIKWRIESGHTCGFTITLKSKNE